MKICSRVYEVSKENNYYSIKTDAYEIRLWTLTGSIIRIRAGFNGLFQEASYSLVTTAWQDLMDEYMSKERNRIDVAESEIRIVDVGEYESTNGGWLITTDQLELLIDRDPFRISIFNKEGLLLHRDIVDLGYRQDSNARSIHTFEINQGDGFYGFGEQTGNFNKYQDQVTLSPSDAMGYDPKHRSGLYKHIPFFIKANENNHSFVGYFYHNTYDAQLDMGKSHSNYWARHANVMFDGGDIDLFIITGDKPKDIVSGYTLLTGRSAMLPKKALGYLGSSMYYSELSKDCDKALVKFIKTAKKEGFPIDGFQLSSGYTSQQVASGEKRCVFTWNKERFPEPKEYFSKMKEMGIVVSPNVKPGILLDHPNLKEFQEADMLVKASEEANMLTRALENGEKLAKALEYDAKEDYAIGTWWGGKGVFVDFTNPKARKAWSSMLKENVLRYGTTSIWNDNCEYESIIDKDARTCFEGRGASISESRNVQSNLMCKVTWDAICQEYDNTRPFIVCRAGHAGIQRYAQNWSGDNLTCWDTLKYNIATMLGMSLCGISNYGCDIGGFYGPAPEPELLVRWVQNGIFHPRFSIHSVNTDNTVTEPWMYSEYTGLISEAVKLRYALSAYYYSLMQEANETGIAIMRPFLMEFPYDSNSYDVADSFMIGSSLLVSNVIEPGECIHEVYFPSETGDVGLPQAEVNQQLGFYDLESREFFIGGQEEEMDVSLGDIPMFIRSGGIIPIVENQLMNLDDDITDIRYICAGDSDGEFCLYEDDGKSFDYKDGMYLKTIINMKSDESKCIINFDYEGQFESTIKTATLDVISKGICPCLINIKLGNNGIINMQQYLYMEDFDLAESGWYYDIAKNSTYVKYPYIKEAHGVTISYDSLDMLGM